MKKFYYSTYRDIISCVISFIIEIIVCILITKKLIYASWEGWENWEDLITVFKISNIIVWVFIFSISITKICSIYVNYYYRLLKIGTDQIVFQEGMLNKTRIVIPIYQVKTCKIQSTVLQRFCGSADLYITTAGDGPEICFYDIANGEEAYEIIISLISK